MIYVFNKNKMLSYVLACSFVLMLFIFQDSVIPNKDVELVKVSSNIIDNSNNNEKGLNNVNNIKNSY